MDRNNFFCLHNNVHVMVALRKESVDRNIKTMNALSGLNRSLSARRAWIEMIFPLSPRSLLHVALRKESVDRNICCHLLNIPAGKVALRKESVDRNVYVLEGSIRFAGSLSARRAWIEISFWYSSRIIMSVALRKESVDRNSASFAVVAALVASLSARRAWIEILPSKQCAEIAKSLSARRAWIEISFWYSSRIIMSGRSPQGERG